MKVVKLYIVVVKLFLSEWKFELMFLYSIRYGQYLVWYRNGWKFLDDFWKFWMIYKNGNGFWDFLILIFLVFY